MPEAYIAVAVEDPAEINPRLEIKQCIQMLENIIAKEERLGYGARYSGMFSVLLFLAGALYAYFYTQEQETLFENDKQEWELEKENNEQELKSWWDLCARINVEKENWVTEQVTPLIEPLLQQIDNYKNNATEIFNKFYYDFIPGSFPAISCPEVDRTNIANSSYCADLTSAYQTIAGLAHDLRSQINSIEDNMERLGRYISEFYRP